MMRFCLRLSTLGLIAGGLLAGCASTPAPRTVLGDEPRSITLHHPASGETVSVTYRRADGYDGDAMKQISILFRDRRTGEVLPVDPALIDTLAELRQRCGAAADTPVHITSGYRSQATNVALARSNPNVAENSYHMRGMAADFAIPGVAPRRIAEEAAAMQRGGYALYAHTGHVHVDTGPVRTWTPRGGEPRGSTPILEARAAGPRKPAAKAPGKSVEVAEAEPAPAPRKPASAPAPKAASREADAGKADADLARVRYVLAQLKEQPVPAARRRQP